MTDQPNEPKRVQVSNLCPDLSFDENAIEALICTLDQHGSFDPPSGELSLAFVDKDEISRLHQEFMDDPSPTDVITFPGDPDFDQAGEVCVCPNIAAAYAQAHQLDFSEELALYVIHGYLHLCGFDDIDDADRKDMREAEQIAICIAKDANVLPRFTYGKDS